MNKESARLDIFFRNSTAFNESKPSSDNSHQKHKDNRVSETFFSASA